MSQATVTPGRLIQNSPQTFLWCTETIPESIRDLTNLQILALDNNALQGACSRIKISAVRHDMS